jgi:PleD family two-component response regulator
LAVVKEDDKGLDALYARADEAMYKAKRQGKDQIVQG